MPRIIILFGFLAYISSPAYVQADTDTQWSDRLYLSGRLGLDLATHAGPGANDQSVGASYKFGFTAGVSAELRLSKYWAAQVGVDFTRKGPDTTKDGMYFGTYRMSYLEFPLLAHVGRSVLDRVEIHGHLGPALGILLDADVDLADGRHFDLGGFKPIDIGLILGAGVAVEIWEGRGSVVFDFRYSHGLLNIDKTAALEDDDVMNRAFYFTVGYRTTLDTLLGGSSGASISPQEPPSSPEPVPADAPTPAPPSDAQPPPEHTSPPGEPPAHQPGGLQGKRRRAGPPLTK